jgi:hypothetical protein
MKLFRSTIIICEGCVNGDGQQCSTRGCYLYGHRVDLPVSVDDPVEIAEVPDRGREIEQAEETTWEDFSTDHPEFQEWP